MGVKGYEVGQSEKKSEKDRKWKGVKGYDVGQSGKKTEEVYCMHDDISDLLKHPHNCAK